MAETNYAADVVARVTDRITAVVPTATAVGKVISPEASRIYAEKTADVYADGERRRALEAAAQPDPPSWLVVAVALGCALVVAVVLFVVHRATQPPLLTSSTDLGPTVQPVPLGPDTRRPPAGGSLLRTPRPLPAAHEAETTDLPVTAELRRALRRVR